jgi:hypothetical protein
MNGYIRYNEFLGALAVQQYNTLAVVITYRHRVQLREPQVQALLLLLA